MLGYRKYHITRAIKNRLNREGIKYNYNEKKGTIEFTYNKKNFDMFVENYPFRPPTKIKVDNKYIDYAIMSNEIQNIIYKFFEIRCLCCISILCPNTWSVMTKFSDVIDEYENFMSIINSANNYKILKSNRILDKFPDEIEFIIMSFLKPNFIFGEKEYQGLKI